MTRRLDRFEQRLLAYRKEHGMTVPASTSPEVVICHIEGCETPARYRGQELCGMHYQRIRNHGAPDLPDPPPRRDLFLGQVKKDEAGCWIWQGAMSSAGYGLFSTLYAHRFAYTEWVGPIPDGKEIDHLCRVRACCNPQHLEAVTRRINFLRGDHPTAQAHRAKFGGVR